MTAAAVKFLQSLRVLEWARGGKSVRVAAVEKAFGKGAIRKSNSIACLSVGRGNGKSALSAGLALGELLGQFNPQPRREVLIAARTRDQAKIAWSFCEGFARSLPENVQKQLKLRRAPTLEIEYSGNGGGILRAIPPDGKNALGTAPKLVLFPDRRHCVPHPPAAPHPPRFRTRA